MKNWGFTKISVLVFVLMLSVQPSFASQNIERAGTQTRLASFSFEQVLSRFETLFNDTIRIFGLELESNTGEEQDPIG